MGHAALCCRPFSVLVLGRSRPLIVDAHHHLWNTTEYSQFSPYLEGEYLTDIASVSGIQATVYLECHSGYDPTAAAHLRCVGETTWVDRLVKRYASVDEGCPRLCAAIIPSADFRLGYGVQEVLQAHLDASSHTRGIRQCTNWDPDPALQFKVLNNHPGMMSDTEFRRGFSTLRKYSLTFDAWVYHTQLDELADLARSFPDTPIVIDHLGGPLGIHAYTDRQEAVYCEWKTSIEGLSRCENVFIKLGGLNMALAGIKWSVGREALTAEEIIDKTRRYYLHAIDKFSPARCMFESNFPVDKHSCTYRALWGAFQLLANEFSPSEQAAMLGGTATSFYRLHRPGANEARRRA